MQRLVYKVTTLTFALLAAGNHCPYHHPVAYNDGNHCCASNMEKECGNLGQGCDGSFIGNGSRCCKGDEFVPCLKKPCQNHDCGLKPRLANRIVRGKEAQEHAFPWMASIRNYNSHWCGGSLITPNYVMTAGHCMRYFGKINSTKYWKRDPRLSVVLGDHYLNTTDPQEQIFSVANYTYLEPEKNRSGLSLMNDVAVVKLNGTAVINSYVATICLPYFTISLSPGDQVIVSGWGWPKYPTYDAYPDASNVLKVAKAKVIKNEDCGNFFPSYDKNGNPVWHGQQAGEDVICTIEEEGRTIPGDSGSPLMYIDPITDRYVQVGINSYMSGRISEEGYANVTYFLRDIEEMMTELDKY